MKKILISSGALTGTPLTDEELKSIIGGLRTTSCSCEFHLSGGGSSSQTVAADTEDICISKCENKCDTDPNCVSVTAKYSSVNS